MYDFPWFFVFCFFSSLFLLPGLHIINFLFLLLHPMRPAWSSRKVHYAIGRFYRLLLQAASASSFCHLLWLVTSTGCFGRHDACEPSRESVFL